MNASGIRMIHATDPLLNRFGTLPCHAPPPPAPVRRKAKTSDLCKCHPTTDCMNHSALLTLTAVCSWPVPVLNRSPYARKFEEVDIQSRLASRHTGQKHFGLLRPDSLA